MAKSVFGTCHLCGASGKLSFEHVPPEAAFNHHRILLTTFEKFLRTENLDQMRGEYRQRGAGAYTLCIPCNNNTGAWYADSYVKWAHQAMAFLIASRGRASFALPYNLYPLRVLKQVVCMFFSVNGPEFHKAQPDLVRFVLNRDSKIFLPPVRVYAFHTFSERGRASAATGLIRGLGSSNSTLHVLSEITHPPFGFVLALGNSLPPDSDLCDISGFSRFEYRDWRAAISMKLPLKSIYTPFPGDYRAREQTLIDVEESKRYEIAQMVRA